MAPHLSTALELTSAKAPGCASSPLSTVMVHEDPGSRPRVGFVPSSLAGAASFVRCGALCSLLLCGRLRRHALRARRGRLRGLAHRRTLGAYYGPHVDASLLGRRGVRQRGRLVAPSFVALPAASGASGGTTSSVETPSRGSLPRSGEAGPQVPREASPAALHRLAPRLCFGAAFGLPAALIPCRHRGRRGRRGPLQGGGLILLLLLLGLLV